MAPATVSTVVVVALPARGRAGTASEWTLASALYACALHWLHLKVRLHCCERLFQGHFHRRRQLSRTLRRVALRSDGGRFPSRGFLSAGVLRGVRACSLEAVLGTVEMSATSWNGGARGLADGRVCEIFSSSCRVASSRNFVVAHLDGFVYLLDKYFRVWRVSPVRSAGGPHWKSRVSSAVLSEDSRGRPSSSLFLDSTSPRHYAGTDGHVGCHLEPALVADVLCSLAESDKRVLSQLITGDKKVRGRGSRWRVSAPGLAELL